MSADLRHLMTVELVTNVAYRDVTARDVTARLEKRHAGFRVMSGPYAVTAHDGKKSQAEKLACVRAVKDQQRAGCAVKVVMVGRWRMCCAPLKAGPTARMPRRSAFLKGGAW